jgi:sn-glycerol 3-phosphate transport system permease protein
LIKRVTFKHKWLPYALLAPQLLITLVFFIWPASQALYYSVLQQDAFGLRVDFVAFDNFAYLFSDPTYLESFEISIMFSVSVALMSLSFALILAVMADRVIKGATAYKTLLIWPYAVAPAIA